MEFYYEPMLKLSNKVLWRIGTDTMKRNTLTKPALYCRRMFHIADGKPVL
jgi:hypothetical protein